MPRITASTSPVGKKKIKVGDTEDYVLPTVPHPVSADINDYHFLISGEAGIGKTSSTMTMPGVFLISFDPFHKSLNVIEEYCAGTVQGFRKFLKILKALEAACKNTFPYPRVVIDGADLWFRACQKYVCYNSGVEHPADGKYGKVWDALKSEFISVVDRMMALPCGIWFVCHAKDKEVEKRDGTKVEKLRPVLSNAAEEILVGKVNGLFNFHYINDERVCRIRGSEDISAKCNVDGHFQTPKGRQVVDIMLGDEGPKVAYERIIKAFHNRQTYVGYDEYQKRKEKDNPAPVKVKKTFGKK